MRLAATQSTIRMNNQALIIEYIIENGQTSRAKLAKNLKISKPTISHNAEQLIEKGILFETGAGESSGGRKPTLLEFNYKHKTIIAIDLNRNKPIIALADLKGHILDQTSIIADVTDGKPILIQKLTTGINEIIYKNSFTLEHLGAITIAIPGVINEMTGEIFANPQFNLWTNLNLKKVLSEIYHLPIIMKNDISMAALGEKHFGAGKMYDDLIYVSVGLGVGAGLILHGELFEGKRKAAGEIGYSRVLGLNNETSLEDEISTLAIIKKIENAIDGGRETVLADLERIDLDEIKKAISIGDEYAIEVVKEVGQALGTAVANIAIMLDLEQIIIGGVLSDLGDLLIDSIKRVVNVSLPIDVEVDKSELGIKAGVKGLVVIAKDSILEGLVE